MKLKYTIKNWDKFQQYKDDRPVHWIKLHTSLIDHYEFDELPELSQLHLIKLWLFAGKSKGVIEGSDKFIARKIGAKSVNMELLVKSGFIIRTNPYEDLEESVPRGEERRVEENRVEEIVNSPPSPKKQASGVPYQKIIDLYHDKLPNCPQVAALSVDRKTKIKARWNNGLPDIESWEDYFNHVGESDFLTGKVQPVNGRKTFVANIDFLIKEGNVLKIFEGNYD